MAKFLYLSHNKLDSIETNKYTGLFNLDTFKLDHNLIEDIQDDLLPL